MPEPHTPGSDTPALTPDGLTAILRDAGTLNLGSVTALAITERLRTIVSNLRFMTVTYSADARPRLPNRLLLKWPLDTPAVPDRGTPELRFYRELAPALTSPPVVRCLAASSLLGGHQCLLLEDLRSTHTNPPWPLPPTPKEAEQAVSVLAQLHSRWWEARTLGASVGTLHTETSIRAMVGDIAAHLPGFLDELSDGLAARDRRLLEAVFGSSLAPWLRLVDSRGLTVTHGDAHTWNFLFPRSGEGLPYLIDWQLWHLDVGARDLAFMIALHWTPTLRQNVELPLLHLYHERLTGFGITGYSFEDLWLDYRLCVVRNLTFPIILWSRRLPTEAWRLRLDCALAAYRDLHGEDFL